MLKLILLAALVALVLLLIIAARRPDTFSIERSLHVQAPAATVFALVNDMPGAIRWNPFMKKDPAIRLSYTGPASGPGATCDFAGNNQVGSGRVAITSVVVPSQVTMSLVMTSPLKADNTVVFSMQPEGNGTRITWAMSGAQPFIGKLMSVIFNMDKMVGGEFDKGLADLKRLAETG
jgi:hypothetical protein